MEQRFRLYPPPLPHRSKILIKEKPLGITLLEEMLKKNKKEEEEKEKKL